MGKKSSSSLEDMQQILYCIRPYLIAHLNDEMLKNYQEEFIIKHGLPPTQDQLNRIFQINVEKQSCAKKADKIIEETIEKLKKELLKKYRIELSLNVTFNIMVITASISYICLYIGHELLPDLKISSFYHPVFFINAIVVASVMFIKIFWDSFAKE